MGNHPPSGQAYAQDKEGNMAKQREIKFRDLYGDLVGCQNGMTFIIWTEPGPVVCTPTHWVTVSQNNGKLVFSTIDHQYFRLDEAVSADAIL